MSDSSRRNAQPPTIRAYAFVAAGGRVDDLSEADDLSGPGESESPDRDRWRQLAKALTDAARVASLRAEGLEVGAIAERMGWSYRTLQNWMAAAEIMRRKGMRMPRTGGRRPSKSRGMGNE